MDVELRHLRAFVTVARLGSFTRAAEEMAITQPALSRTVSQLENALRVRLLDRTSRHVELTGEGRVFLGDAERVLADVDRAVAAARRQSRLRLGFSWLLPDPWAQDMVTRFEAATGSTVVMVRADDAVAAVERGTVDVALLRGDPRWGAGELRIVHLFDEARVAVCAVKHLLATRDHVDWEEIPDWPLVVNILSGTTGPWSWPDRQPRTVVETENFDEWIESVAAGRGIGVVPEVARRRSVHPAVTFVPLRNAPPIPVSLAFVPGRQERLVRKFVEAALRA
ncbi:LysR family transcriptional regulator [Herbidospora galbida]|uniref:LysR family transcriptional regulator n=1 Tax=Herbidospora galbida TaxID=2575442 RepID=A0A4U3MS18_9ACTN|nr:LysR family transcriptional regulator [Herbidospora galbida]TKK91684.1 LysR family transcriptional regulator [Herbidospora galbida]